MERGHRVECSRCGRREVNKITGNYHKHPKNVEYIICALCCQPDKVRQEQPRFRRGR